ISPNEIERFSDFPLSNKTLKGLQEAQYRMVTEIERQTIGLSLQGKDVLGAAKTGSGKTLAFIIPNAVGFADMYKTQIYKNNMKTAAPHSVTIEVLFVVCLQTLCTYFCNVNTSSQVPGRSPSLPGAQWPGPSISKISGKDIENREYKQHMLCKPAPLDGSIYFELSLIEKPFQKLKALNCMPFVGVILKVMISMLAFCGVLKQAVIKALGPVMGILLHKKEPQNPIFKEISWLLEEIAVFHVTKLRYHSL
ncbi:unnamed protein product, partial [Eretmochelys imbricata]